MNDPKIGAVILAAGKGTRLGCVDKPKVMLEIGGKPIVQYIIDTLLEIGFEKRNISLVVGFKKEKVEDHFGPGFVYANQEQQLGTGHAAYVGMRALPPEVETVLVLQGDDSAFYKPATLLNALKKHIENKTVLTLLTARVSDPSQLGRILRTPDGQVAIVEKEYVTEDQKNINEISTGTFIYNRAWYEKIFPEMPPLKKLGEYGQPTALAMAREEKMPYQVIEIGDSSEWNSINTPEELKLADKLKTS